MAPGQSAAGSCAANKLAPRARTPALAQAARFVITRPTAPLQVNASIALVVPRAKATRIAQSPTRLALLRTGRPPQLMTPVYAEWFPTRRASGAYRPE